MKKTMFLICIMFIFVSCKSDDSEKTVLPTYVNDIFELETNKDWKLINEQGIDTYVGYYFKNPDTIHFSCGPLAFGALDEIKAESTIYFEEIEIDNCPSKIVTKQIGKNRWCWAFIQKQNDEEMKTMLLTINPSNESEIIKIFKTHHFK